MGLLYSVSYFVSTDSKAYIVFAMLENLKESCFDSEICKIHRFLVKQILDILDLKGNLWGVENFGLMATVQFAVAEQMFSFS